jgi:Zn-dependent M32 family carboxypeptidase
MFRQLQTAAEALKSFCEATSKYAEAQSVKAELYAEKAKEECDYVRFRIDVIKCIARKNGYTLEHAEELLDHWDKTATPEEVQRVINDIQQQLK